MRTGADRSCALSRAAPVPSPASPMPPLASPAPALVVTVESDERAGGVHADGRGLALCALPRDHRAVSVAAEENAVVTAIR